MSSNGKGTLRVTVSVNNDWIDSTESNQEILGNFMQYKGDSLNLVHRDKGGAIVTPNPNFVTPNENLQASNPRIHPLFGRDRIFDYPPQLLADIHFHGLAHVHIVDPTGYSDDQPQWDCTSNAAAVYSAFSLGPMHYHYHVVEIYNGGKPYGDAHQYYATGDIEAYIAEAADCLSKKSQL